MKPNIRTNFCPNCEEQAKTIEALQARVEFLEDGMNKAHPLIQSAQYEGSVENINQDRWLNNWFDDQGELK